MGQGAHGGGRQGDKIQAWGQPLSGRCGGRLQRGYKGGGVCVATNNNRHGQGCTRLWGGGGKGVVGAKQQVCLPSQPGMACNACSAWHGQGACLGKGGRCAVCVYVVKAGTGKGGAGVWGTRCRQVCGRGKAGESGVGGGSGVGQRRVVQGGVEVATCGGVNE